MGHKVGLLNCMQLHRRRSDSDRSYDTTTRSPFKALMARMVEAGCEYAFMEVSSHSIDQKRIQWSFVPTVIFTNLTRDHLDYHKTVENYLKAKKKFFDDLPANALSL